MIKIRRLCIMNIIWCCTLLYPTFIISAYFIEEEEISVGTSDYITMTIFDNFLQQVDTLIAMSKINDIHLVQAIGMVRRSFLEQQANHQLTSKRVLHLIEKFNNWRIWYEHRPSLEADNGVFLHALHELSLQALHNIRRETCDDRIRSEIYTKNKKFLCIAIASPLIGCLLYHGMYSDKHSFFNRLVEALRLQMSMYSQRDEQTKREGVLTIIANEIKSLKQRNDHLIGAFSDKDYFTERYRDLNQKVNNSDLPSINQQDSEQRLLLENMNNDLPNVLTKLSELKAVLDKNTYSEELDLLQMNYISLIDSLKTFVDEFFKKEGNSNSRLNALYERISSKLQEKRSFGSNVASNQFHQFLLQVASQHPIVRTVSEPYFKRYTKEKDSVTDLNGTKQKDSVAELNGTKEKDAVTSLSELLNAFKIKMGILIKEYEALDNPKDHATTPADANP